jgi:rod shape-determining protein MreC
MPPGTFLGTLDRTPPPFFRQGPSALTKLVVCAALALFLMAADARFAFVVPLRAALATVLLPMQRALVMPFELLHGGSDYLRGLEQARQAQREAEAALAGVAERARQADRLAAENLKLRELLTLGPALAPRSLAAEIMYEARDAYSHKVVIDRGQTQGVLAGAPVVDAQGVLGQVTRVYPLSAEVTLLTDKDAVVPVLNARTGKRMLAFGGVQGPAGAMMELRYLTADVDLQEGDLLQTHGLDGVYPPGLPVARVAAVERRPEGGLERVLLAPASQRDDVRHVLVLEPTSALRPPPAAPAASAAPAARGPSAASAGSAASTPARERAP